MTLAVSAGIKSGNKKECVNCIYMHPRASGKSCILISCVAGFISLNWR